MVLNANESVNATTPGWSSLWMYIMYIFQGSIIGGSNLVIVLVIARYSALRSRKEYLVMAAQAFADGCNQTGYLLAGLYRTWLVVTGQFSNTLSPWQCLLVPHSLLWIWTNPTSNLMLAITSLDRLLAVLFPLKYIGWPRLYSWMLIGGAYAYSIGIALVMSISVMVTQDQQIQNAPAVCYTNTMIGQAGFPRFKEYFQKTSPVFATTSVMIYVVILVKYKRSQIGPAGDTEKMENLRQQRKMTISIGLSCLCTLFLSVLPMQIGFLMVDLGFDNFGLMAFIMSNLNPLCNASIYPTRHHDIRQGLKALLTCKQMPDNVRMWRVNQEAKRATKDNIAMNLHGKTRNLQPREVSFIQLEQILSVVSR